MEDTCQRCHADIVPPDAAFCSNCGLPQLRISEDAIASAETAQDNANPAARSATPGELRADWRFALRCAFFVAIPAAIFFLFGLRFEAAQLLLFLWILCGSLLAVLLYHRGRPALPMTFRIGARIGSTTGALIALFLFIAFSIATFNMRMHNDARVSDTEYRDRIRDFVAQNRENLQQLHVDPKGALDLWSSAEYRAGATVFSCGIYGLILVGMSAITGALGAAVLRTNRVTQR